ncbi:hypothetical protein Q1695_010066 [Nippostrongylus brasiliensis]|nr:hypothetical protein Q1695_010066 [Nippostrongylus brasiliensis]
MSFSNGNLEKVQLSNEELQKLLNKMSSDERAELTQTLKSCTTEMTMTRGLPITAAVLGSLYFARTRLPPQYHFGPKGWPFYAIMGIGTLTTANILSMGNCRERVQPLIAKLWQKYNIGHSSSSYEEIRRRHRQEEGFSVPDNAQDVGRRLPPRADDQGLYGQRGRAYADTYGLGTETTLPNDGMLTGDSSHPPTERTFDLVEGTTTEARRSTAPPQGYMYGGDTPTYMSGTPVSPRTSEYSPDSGFIR